jgi:cell wall-associated NlpC family hydrolase
MSASAVLSRIDEIRGTIATLSGAAPVSPSTTSSTSTTSTTSASGASGTDFAQALSAATGSTAGVGAADVGAGTGGGPDGDDVVADAKKYLGIPYRWGGTDPSSGLDCSGLVQRVFKDLGVTLPRVVADQRDAGTAVPSMAQARPGDLLVFGSHHIGIYVGNGRMLHAPHTGDHVRIGKVYETPTRIRRVLPAGDGSAPAAASGGVARPAALRAATATGADAVGATRFDGLFSEATRRYDLPAGLLKAVARAESNFNAGARRGAGAVGLMQLMPGTARELGVDPSVPAQAVDGAARLLKQHLRSFGTVPLALAAYNAGPGAVRRYDGIPPYAETQTYVRRVMSAMGGTR